MTKKGNFCPLAALAGLLLTLANPNTVGALTLPHSSGACGGPHSTQSCAPALCGKTAVGYGVHRAAPAAGHSTQGGACGGLLNLVTYLLSLSVV